MLIIAIPKSASTSLLKTLGKLHFMEAEQKFALKLPVPSGFQILSEFHTDIRELDDNHIKEFTAQDKIYKQHLPPTQNNLALLKSVPKVVLLRNPVEVLQSYYRAFQKGLSKNKSMQTTFATQSEWLEHADKTGLKKELEAFYNGWKNEEGKLTLLIEYSDLMQNAASQIHQIESFFGLPQSSRNIRLAKSRYAQTGVLSGKILYLYQGVKSSFFNLLKKTGLYKALLGLLRKFKQ